MSPRDIRSRENTEIDVPVMQLEGKGMYDSFLHPKGGSTLYAIKEPASKLRYVGIYRGALQFALSN